MSDRIESLRSAAANLARCSDGQILDGIDRALSRWTGDGGLAARAAGDIAKIRGASETMLRFGLDRMVAAYDRTGRERWWRDARREAESPGRVGIPGRVIVQILAGNVAGLAIPAALEALLARRAVVLKPAEGDPVSAGLFLESLQAEAPELAAAVDVSRWAGGDEAVEDPLFREVDLVVASGGEAMAASLSARVPGPLRVHGPSHGIGVVGMGWPDASDDWWEQVAREIVLWDQEGCLSPRVLLVPGYVHEFAARLAPAMQTWEERWPARVRSASEAAAVQEARARFAMREGTGLIESAGTAWTVAWDREDHLEPGPPHRFVRVSSRPDPDRLADLLAGIPDRIQGVGLDLFREDTLPWHRALASVPYRNALTRVQDPPAGWRPDGRSGLAELLAG